MLNMLWTAVAIVIFSITFTNSLPAPAGVSVNDKGDVSASWGGYSASAGLGGLLGNTDGTKGGLHAEAGTPSGQFAAAGLGGVVGDKGTGGGLYSAAGTGSGTPLTFSTSLGDQGNKVRPIKNTGTVFDDIFNIPQSVLKSVNDFLNKRANNAAHAGGASADNGVANKNDVNISPGHPIKGGNKLSYDEIFSIPQSVLTAVNRLLNRL